MKSHGILKIVALTGFAAAWLVFLALSWADAATPENPSPQMRAPASADSGEESEYNFNWLDPEKKIYVLQNRKYLKKDRAMVSVLAGPGISNAYRNTGALSGRLGYYFSEWLGLEAFHTMMSNSENKTFEQLRFATTNIVPVVREIRSQTGVVVNYVPWYAKINVFNSILYFDWYFSGGAGVLNSQLDRRTNASLSTDFVDQNFTSVFLGTGQMFHLSQHFTVRLDATGAFYRAPVYGTSGEKTWFSNYLFGFGFGVKL